MAVEFTGANGQHIAININTGNLINFSVSAWVYIDSLPTSPNDKIIMRKYGAGGRVDWMLSAYANSTPTIWFTVFDGPTQFLVAYAYTSILFPISTGVWSHYVATYEHDPLLPTIKIYENGNEVEYGDTESNGIIRVDSDGDYPLLIGGSSLSGFTIDGKIEDPRIYNRILSQSEITELYQSRMIRSVSNGLVFHPVFCGAAGLSKFDGATLGTANTIADWVSGAIGIPYGNPIGRGNTEQRIY